MSARPSDVLADSWYADALELTSLDSLVRSRVGRRALRLGPLRGAILWWKGRRYAVVVTTLAGSATRSVLILERLFSRRRQYLVLLEFIPVTGADARTEWGARGGVTALLARLYLQHIVGPVLRRCLLVCQSLTRWEMARNAEAFGLPLDRFVFIPFMAADSTLAPVEPAEDRQGVFASGRAACDWETVFAAAAGQEWPLTVVCSQTDLPRVQALNRDERATVRTEISREEHDRLMSSSAVYLLALREAEVSSGQVRLVDAAAHGIPVVASAVRGLKDYLEPGITASVFAPGDSRRAAAEIGRLLADPKLASSVAAGARRHSSRWTRADYLAALRAMVLEAGADRWPAES